MDRKNNHTANKNKQSKYGKVSHFLTPTAYARGI